MYYRSDICEYILFQSTSTFYISHKCNHKCVVFCQKDQGGEQFLIESSVDTNTIALPYRSILGVFPRKPGPGNKCCFPNHTEELEVHGWFTSVMWPTRTPRLVLVQHKSLSLDRVGFWLFNSLFHFRSSVLRWYVDQCGFCSRPLMLRYSRTCSWKCETTCVGFFPCLMSYVWWKTFCCYVVSCLSCVLFSAFPTLDEIKAVVAF